MDDKFPKISTIHSPKEMDKGQGLVEAIMIAIDDYSDTQPITNLDVYGALEIVKYNYLVVRE